MKTIMSYIEPQSWTFMRVLRIAMGSVVLYQGVSDHEWILAGLGSVFLLQGILNAGCASCAGNSCEVKR